MPLTSSMEDYLEAVLIVAKKQIEVRSVDIARQLNVSKPSVWRATAPISRSSCTRTAPARSGTMAGAFP